MNARDLTLDIAVNLSRVARWATEGQEARVRQFLQETEGFIEQLDSIPKRKQFNSTFKAFKKSFRALKDDVRMDSKWAEEALTWGNILTHRAKLV